MNILGVTGNFGKDHDASAVLIQNDTIVAAAEEERFVRYKHAIGMWPERAIKFCLDEAGITMEDVDFIAYPFASREMDRTRHEAFFRYNFGYAPPIRYIDHHTSHAASAYYISGFDDSLVVTFDRTGDGFSSAAFRGKGTKMENIDRVAHPNSLGLFAAYMTQYLGFRSNHDEYKVMGLSSYGTPAYDLSPIAHVENGSLAVDVSFIHPEALVKFPLFPTSQLPICKDEEYSFMPGRRRKDEPVTPAHKNLAASAQKVIEDAMIAYVLLHKGPKDRNLCLAGGVAENSVACGKISELGLFDKIYVSPAANDAGTSLGAALVVASEQGYRFGRMTDNKLGPKYTNDYIETMLKNYGVNFYRSDDVVDEAAGMLADQHILGWFQGRMEFGPRALGARSLLADPSTVAMRDRVNRIKKREQFRPFAPSVLEEHAGELFVADQASPFMSFTLNTSHEGRETIVAATHVDGTGRLQTVPRDGSRYRQLIEAFYEKTGIPAVLNTSLNSGWEPIVESPDQALAFLFSSEATALVLEDYIVTTDAKTRRIEATGAGAQEGRQAVSSSQLPEA